MPTAFGFMQCATLLKATGVSARTLAELRSCVETVPGDSIFHHTAQYFLKGRVSDYTNDFAQWAGESLEERALSERLSSVDPYAASAMEAVRADLLRVLDEHLAGFPPPREALEGDAFHFNTPVTFVYPAGLRAANLAEFLVALEHLPPESIYFHFYEARVRLRGGMDDFSRWVEGSLEKGGLAGRIRSIDPFMHGVEGVRRLLVAAVREELDRDMGEALG